MNTTITEMNIVKTLIDAFECNCKLFNELAMFYGDSRRISSNEVDAIENAMNNASTLFMAMPRATLSYKQSRKIESVVAQLLKNAGVNSSNAESALKSAITDVLGI